VASLTSLKKKRKKTSNLTEFFVSSSPKRSFLKVMSAPTLVEKIRTALSDKIGGWNDIIRMFRMMDENKDQCLSKAELAYGLACYKINLTDKEFDELFNAYDTDGNGSIDFQELYVALCPGLSKRRLSFIRSIFGQLDMDHSGTLELEELEDLYRPNRHPDVLTGKKTIEQVSREFIDQFDVNHDGVVSEDEWVKYYHKLSAEFDDDDFFEKMVMNTLHLVTPEIQKTRQDIKAAFETAAKDPSKAAEEKQGVNFSDVYPTNRKALSRLILTEPQFGSTQKERQRYEDFLYHRSFFTAKQLDCLMKYNSKKAKSLEPDAINVIREVTEANTSTFCHK
jgi:Ca2+-binding EF-hand superfamily protein